MKRSVLFSLSVVLALAVMFGITPTAAYADWDLLGTYTVNYRWNCAGSYGDPNPYFGPYHDGYYLDCAPGIYRVVATGFGGSGGNTHVWTGDATSGSHVGGPGPEVGDYIDLTHTHGQIVLYSWDWYNEDNSPESWLQVELYSGTVPSGTVPEPMSMMLGIMGLGSVAGLKRLRRK